MVFASRFNLLNPPLLVLQSCLVWQLCEFQPLDWNFHPGSNEQCLPFTQQPCLKRCMHIKKALSGFKVCQVFANTSHFCLVLSRPSLYRSESSGRKPSSPLRLSVYATLSSDIHKGTAVCKVWFEGCVGLAYSATNFVRSDCSDTFLWLPITQISNTGALLLCLCKRHTY